MGGGQKVCPRRSHRQFSTKAKRIDRQNTLKISKLSRSLKPGFVLRRFTAFPNRGRGGADRWSWRCLFFPIIDTACKNNC